MQAEDRVQWLKERKRGIGGSDAATLFDVNPWASRFSLYHDKVSSIVDDTDSPAQEWGRRFEPVVRQAYEEKLGRVVSPGSTLQTHPEFAFMLANTDGRIEPCREHDGYGVYEGKTAWRDMYVQSAEAWDDGVPLYYQIQVQHYMAVLGYEWASVACFVMGKSDPFVWRDVERNERFIAALVAREHDFWTKHVLAREPPPADESKATSKAIRLLYPEDSGKTIVLPPEATGWWQRKAELAAEIKTLETEAEAIKDKIRLLMGDAAYGVLPGLDSGVSYKSQRRRTEVSDVVKLVAEDHGPAYAADLAARARQQAGTQRTLRSASAKTMRFAAAETGE